jgi:hypothetical protein
VRWQGMASRLILPHTFNTAFTLSRLWWPDLIVMALGAVLLTVSFVRSESKPYLPSVVVAYELFHAAQRQRIRPGKRRR